MFCTTNYRLNQMGENNMSEKDERVCPECDGVSATFVSDFPSPFESGWTQEEWKCDCCGKIFFVEVKA